MNEYGADEGGVGNAYGENLLGGGQMMECVCLRVRRRPGPVVTT